MSGSCTGNNEDHCCWVDGAVCPHLEENTVPGRRWACGLLRELGTWEAVSADQRWIDAVKPMADRLGIATCGEWPLLGQTCATCGLIGE